MENALNIDSFLTDVISYVYENGGAIDEEDQEERADPGAD
jgi:hypothetical protein